MSEQNDSNVTESEGCYLKYGVLYYMPLGIAGLLSLITLVLIPSHRQLRQRRFIFQFNVILADFVTIGGLIAQIILNRTQDELLDGMRLITVIGTNVSLVNILFIAVYQLITIRIDPFGVRNIITTPRCIAACIASWTSLSFLVMYKHDEGEIFGELIGTTVNMILCLLTGLCLCLIYHAVSTAKCDGNNQMMERKEENKRLLRTFAMVYGTTLISTSLSLTFSIQDHFELHDCFVHLVMLCSVLNWISNSIVYWWRLKEFRAIVPSCRKVRLMPIGGDM